VSRGTGAAGRAEAGAPPDDRAPIAAWPAIRRRIVALAAVRGRLLVVTDFDGTLARISLDPMAARIEPLARAALRRLAHVAAARPERLQVVVLSGRTVADLAGRVRVGGVEYLGDHGLQAGTLARGARAERVASTSDPALATFVAHADAHGRAVAAAIGRPDWLFVEAKGPSVAFHFRAAPDPEAAGRLVAAAVEERLRADRKSGFERFDGRRIVELRPTGAGGKGTAVASLLEDGAYAGALVLGDDRSDALAFGAVAEATATGRLEAGLALAVHGSSETPPEIVERADLILSGPHDAARALSALAAVLEGEG
jgi:trehalose 6-phosphate phosphatase